MMILLLINIVKLYNIIIILHDIMCIHLDVHECEYLGV